MLYTYDGAGNRIKQEYYCNNGTGRIANELVKNKGQLLDDSLSNDQKDINSSFVKVNALYPNPTDGLFTIRFAKGLTNADILITDVNGKKLNHFNKSGTLIQLDISSKPAGTYFVTIINAGEMITQKIIKQNGYRQ